MSKNRKGKIIFWLLLIIFAVIIVFQNQGFFFTQQKLDVDLYFTQFTIPLTPVVAMFVIVFVLGWLIACIPGMIARYRLQKVNKLLKSQLEEKKSDLESLKTQVEALKQKEPVSAVPDVSQEPPTGTTENTGQPEKEPGARETQEIQETKAEPVSVSEKNQA